MKITVSYSPNPLGGVTCTLDLWGAATLAVTAETRTGALLGAMQAIGAHCTAAQSAKHEAWELADGRTYNVVFR